MPPVIHGRMELKWCHSCNSPVIRGRFCPSCGGELKKVDHTPPGDIRPAFRHDIDEARELADLQWGKGIGDAIFGPGGPTLINPCPAPDRLDELIGYGEVLGSISFRARSLDHILILREGGGRRLMESKLKPTKGHVTADDGALLFLLDGSNLLSPGINHCHEGVKEGDEVLILSEGGCVIGCGNARKDASGMCGTRGMGVKVRWALDPDRQEVSGPAPDDPSWKIYWDRIVEVNRPLIEDLADRSASFIRRTHENEGLLLAVSFSGGKDSLATLLLAMDAGLRPPVMFIDTGIEFPETVSYVREYVKGLGLELLEGRPDISFFDNFDKFGPPGRDFRWCCKGCKLGPTARLISENFKDGVLTLIGQRRYESDTRRKKGSVWTNPWVPGQRGASPVQNWTALDIWLYIFMKKAPYNVLYEKGFARIGCYLCPSMDLSEISSLHRSELDMARWTGLLEEERAQRRLPVEWVKYGFHRFKKLPPHMRELAVELGLEEELLDPGRRKASFGGDPVLLVDGARTCEHGLSREGIIDSKINWDRLANLLNIMGRVKEIEGTGGWEVMGPQVAENRPILDVFSDGTLILKGANEKDISEKGSRLRSVAMRATGCIGCGICVGRCPTGALTIDGKKGQVVIDANRCTHCGSCLGPCPAESFIDDPFDQ